MVKLHVKKGDKVLVISGKDKGKKGKILVCNLERERVVVEGVNLIKKHTRPTQKSPQGGIVQKEGFIHMSNVTLICPSCGAATRVNRTRTEGKLVRICKKCGGEIDKA